MASKASSCRTTIFVAILSASLAAQHPPRASSPKYDAGTETKIQGVVDEVRLPANAKEAVHLLVKEGADTVDVYLCPKAFLDDIGVNFSKGDQITLTGSKVKEGDADLVVAREVVKGADTLVLRDGKGKPVWI